MTEYNEVEIMQLFKEDGKKEERLNVIRDMIKYGDSKERILKQYIEEEYNKALGHDKADK